MIYEKILIDKLYDNIGSCVLIGKNNLLTTKLEKYLKRYLGKAISLNFEMIKANLEEDLINYFSLIEPKELILIQEDEDSIKLISKILNI